MNNSGGNLQQAVTLIDRVSNLPDELLCHILSFLNTKQAVTTSILSKRWEFLWTYLDILKFSNVKYNNHLGPYYGNEYKYLKFVRKVIKLHNASLIKRMDVFCGGIYHYMKCIVRVRRILTALSSKNVQSLNLSFQCVDPRWWPLHFFSSKTLVELRLDYVDITDIVNSPTALFFPNLKKLTLCETMTDTASLNHFMSGCSILEDLTMRHFDKGPAKALYISSATLKALELRCTDSLVGPRGRGKPMIVLNTPALEVFVFEVSQTFDLELLVESNMPSLHEAHIYMSASTLRSLNLFSSSVLCLEVRCWGFLYPIKSDFDVQFHKLTKLEISNDRIRLDLLRFCMEKFNNLKDITLQKCRYVSSFREMIWEQPEHVPKCLLSSLQKICIKGYDDVNKAELKMIKYVLGNAIVLKSMKICKVHMLKKISIFPRASPTCEISVN